jgi:hypothetical protein
MYEKEDKKDKKDKKRQYLGRALIGVIIGGLALATCRTTRTKDVRTQEKWEQ